MSIDIKEENGIEIVAVDGRLVAASSGELRDRVMAVVKDNVKIVMDLAKMSHIDSSGLGVLVQLLQAVNKCGGAMKLCNLQQHPRIVFDITKVYRVFEIFDTLEAALASFV